MTHFSMGDIVSCELSFHPSLENSAGIGDSILAGGPCELSIYSPLEDRLGLGDPSLARNTMSFLSTLNHFSLL